MKKPAWQESVCSDCVFWIRKEAAAGVAPGQGPIGDCRRRPPVPSAVPVGRQESGGIVIGGREHREVQMQIQLVNNYPLCGEKNPSCGDFIPVAPFDKVVQDANRQAEMLLPMQEPPPRKISDR